jgi:DNA replicative helicase MCM subunit Mcm2 (Cdc46/Mcm family)
MYAQDSIELLKQSGIDFAQNETRGIDVRHFGELLTVSGVVLNEDVSCHSIRLHLARMQLCCGACQQRLR